MSFCRAICRLTFRGCLRIPGCKSMCYKCVLPICYNGDSDSDDGDDKDDADYFRSVASPVSTAVNDSQGNTRNFPESVDSTEAVVQVEYYNQVQFFTPKGLKPRRENDDESVVLLSKRSVNENRPAADGNIPNGTGDMRCDHGDEKSVSVCQQYVNMEPPEVNVNTNTCSTGETVPYHNVPVIPPPGMTSAGPLKLHIPELDNEDQTHSSPSSSIQPKSNIISVNLNDISYIDAEEVLESVEKFERDKSKNGKCEVSGMEY